MSLTGEQRIAADCPNNVLLRACPGSGKTRVITTKLISSIDDVRDTPRRIGCITYTNTAVHEIEGRVSRALMPEDEQYFDVSTIHSFCVANILQPFVWRIPGYESGFKILTREMDDFERLVREACASINYVSLTRQDFDDFSGVNLNSNGDLVGTALRSEIVKKVNKKFWAICRREGYLDFCILLFYSLILLRSHPEIADGIASRYALIMVDEFQDTTDIQVEVLSLIAQRNRTKFFLVGDTCQSIFGFAGADPGLADIFAERIAARTDLSLSGNFRSSPAVIVDAERLFSRTPAMTSVGTAKSYTEATRHIHTANPLIAIVDHFLPALADLEIPIGEATILAPSWAPLFPLSRALRDRGVSVVGPGARPYRRARLFAGLAEQLCGYIVDSRPDTFPAIERAVFFLVQEMTGTPKLGIFSYSGRLTVLKLLATATECAQHCPGALDWLDHCSQAIAQQLVEADLITLSQAPLLYLSVQEMKADMIRNGIDTSNYSIDDLGLFASPERALKLSTLHHSKGREYMAVAMIKMHEGAIPFYLAETEKEFEEAKRLFYVGATRAKRLLMYITDSTDSRNRPTRFLGQGGTGHIR
jgi:DNA helicase-2/ATP-dependent DNA helicase PcrA